MMILQMVRQAVEIAVEDLDNDRSVVLANAEVKQLEILHKVLQGPLEINCADGSKRRWRLDKGRVGCITGGVNVEDRKKVIDRLNGRRRRAMVILLSTMAGGAGLDLSGCRELW